MRASPGLVTAAMLNASTTDAEKVDDAKAKEDKNIEAEVKKAAKKDGKNETNTRESEVRCEDPDDVVLTVGSMVITNAKKDKTRFDNFKAEVVRFGKDNKVRVKMLDGPAAGVAKDFPRCNLNLFVAEEKVTEDETEAKRHKTAAELFGPIM
jgi:sRNA-binding protein